MSMFRNDKGRARRRAYPISGYVGPNGGGKSAAMVWDTLPSLTAGRPVLGTVRLLDHENPRQCTDDLCQDDPLSGHFIRALPSPELIAQAFEVIKHPSERIAVLLEMGNIVGVHRAVHPLWIPLVDWQQVLDARGCDLLLDEVTGAASSRDSMALPSAIANKLVQLRRNDVVVRWSAPSWARADKIIRECSQSVTWCKGMLPKVATDEGGQRQWRNRRLFRWKTYDANSFEDFTVGKRQELDTLVRDWHWGPGSPAFAAYDTFDSVLSVGTVNESGTCYKCGGSRRRETCKGHDDEGTTLTRFAVSVKDAVMHRLTVEDPEPAPAIFLDEPAEAVEIG
jgi:hypothetical protein